MRARTQHGYKHHKRSNPDWYHSRNPHHSEGRLRHLQNRETYRAIREDYGKQGLRERGLL